MGQSFIQHYCQAVLTMNNSRVFSESLNCSLFFSEDVGNFSHTNEMVFEDCGILCEFATFILAAAYMLLFIEI